MTETQRSPRASKGLTELIGRALMDETFRDELFTDRTAATKGYNLTETDTAALEQLSREDLEQNAEAFGDASAMAIKIVIKGTF